MDTGSGGTGLAGKVAIVTGAASGIGLAIATDLAAHGARVIMADINAKAGEAAARELQGAAFVRTDLSARADCYALVAQTVAEWGRVDILVNNAGLQKVARLEEFADDDWDRMLAIMLTGPFTLAKAVIPHMYSQGRGRIVNIASVLGLRGAPYKPAYVAAKHGLVGLTKAISLEAASHGVTCNAVCPSWVRTPLMENQVADQARVNNLREDEVLSRVMLTPPMTRLLEPSEVAAVVTFLCGDGAAAITGATISADLGWTAH
jgi:3-hydroxybutyrate dehydrogenase